MFQTDLKEKFGVECVFAVIGPEGEEEQTRRCGVHFSEKSKGIHMQMSNVARSLISGDGIIQDKLLDVLEHVQEKEFRSARGGRKQLSDKFLSFYCKKMLYCRSAY